MYSDFEEAFIQTVDKHAPVKQRKPCQNPAPFINKELRKAVYKKRQLHNKYNKCKTKSNWENYRQQRNLVTKIKKRSIKTYFFERCIGGPKSLSTTVTFPISFATFIKKSFCYHVLIIYDFIFFTEYDKRYT
jgi:hypothetical protein